MDEKTPDRAKEPERAEYDAPRPTPQTPAARETKDRGAELPPVLQDWASI